MTPEPAADVTVEPADSDDVEGMVERWVELAAGQRRHGSHLLADANRARVRETMLRHVVADGARVARRDGAIVGVATFERESEQYVQDVDRGVVTTLYVEAAHRGEGIGSALLAAAERALAGRGVDVVCLEAMAANDAARAFYRANGYDRHRVELETRVESDTSTTSDR